MPINTSNASYIVMIVCTNNAYCYNIPDSYLPIYIGIYMGLFLPVGAKAPP